MLLKFFSPNIYKVHPGPCNHALVVTSQHVSWTVWIIFLYISSLALIGVGWWGSSYSCKFLRWIAWLSFLPGIFSFTRCVVRHLELSGKFLRIPRFHTLCSWYYSVMILCMSFLGGFWSLMYLDLSPSNYLVESWKFYYCWIEYALRLFRGYQVIP